MAVILSSSLRKQDLNVPGLAEFDGQLRIPTASTDPVGTIQSGELYYNTTDTNLYRYTGLQWTATVGEAERLSHTIVEVTASYTASVPEDVFFISGSGNINLYLYDCNSMPSSSIKIKLLTELTLKVYPSASQEIEFNNDLVLNDKGQSIEIFPYKNSWYII